jgi:phage terminase small subunit
MESVRKRILDSYEMTPVSPLALEGSLQMYDRYSQAMETTQRDGITTKGKYGVVPHPAIAIADSSYRQFLSGIRFLGLSVDAVLGDDDAAE